jgi:hypothetical protein
MKQSLKWSLIAVAVVGAATSLEVVTVTYFSSDVRCATCRRIERLTQEVVGRNFAPELRSAGFHTLDCAPVYGASPIKTSSVTCCAPGPGTVT